VRLAHLKLEEKDERPGENSFLPVFFPSENAA
jgi:hypothetical protein